MNEDDYAFRYTTYLEDVELVDLEWTSSDPAGSCSEDL